MLTLLTAYSGFLISRLVHVVSGAVLFGDIGEAAAGAKVGPKIAESPLAYHQLMPPPYTLSFV